MTQASLIFDICRENHKGHENSEAANLVTNKSRDRKKILDWLEANGGGTCDEAEMQLNLSHQTASARFSDLKNDNEIVAVGKRETRTGCKANVYQKRRT